MRSLTLREHGRIVRWTSAEEPPAATLSVVHLEAQLYDRLREHERKRATDGGHVFIWKADHARARQWVGVVSIRGLQVEILPKIAEEDDKPKETRQALLYMLTLAGKVPMRVRDWASLASARGSTPKMITELFARRLDEALSQGEHREHRPREANLSALRGKLLFSKHLRANVARGDRFYCRRLERSQDTSLNRVLKATCLALLEGFTSSESRDVLRRCVAHLREVKTARDPLRLLGEIQLDRQSQRFSEPLALARLLLSGERSEARVGEVPGISVLFDMNAVFERFVEAFIREHVLPLHPGVQLFRQARRKHRHLMQQNGRGILRLEPDIFLVAEDGATMVIDTKWKRLKKPSGQASKGGIDRQDLYQLFAYSQRFGSAHSVLLYPKVPHVREREMDILDADGNTSGHKVCVRFVDLERNLLDPRERGKLCEELSRLVEEGISASRAVRRVG